MFQDDGLSLADLPVGQGATVVGVPNSADPACRRLCDLGFLPGTPVRVVRRAPLGDPTVYDVRGSHTALRRAESREIRVTLSAPVVIKS